MKNMVTQHSFDALRIGLASTEDILGWSYGEVKKAETVDYKSHKPKEDGLFCQKIFGPVKNWECACGKHKNNMDSGIICEKCGVEVTKNRVRRERMGHIDLAAPVSHIWYFKGIPSRMGLILDMTPKNLEKVLYFAEFVVVDPGESSFKPCDLVTHEEYEENRDTPGFNAEMGAAAIRKLLEKIDLDELAKELREELKTASRQKKIKITRRLEVVEGFRKSGDRPEWMILEVLPVIPPDLRPMVQLDGGRFAASDLNEIYMKLINRNNRLKDIIAKGAPDIIVRNEKRMLQEAVDSLIDNGRRGKPVQSASKRNLKSLSDVIKGKQGRFRQNLLGKRVDFSGRSVIVVGPELRFWQCGLPKNMALELFKPFIIRRLVQEGTSTTIKHAKAMIDAQEGPVWDILDEVIKDHPVLLNRAPTLHRLGIQAFEPVLIDGKAIQLHPLVCTAFNADFDGDQMAVHLPLSVEAQAEARFLMLSTNNILAPKDGSSITTPTQDMILGSYYLTYDEIKDEDDEEARRKRKKFTDIDEMLMAYQNGIVDIHDRVEVRRFADKDDVTGKLITSTVGRFIFNEKIPQDIGFVDRSKDKYSLEIDFLCDKRKLGEIIDMCYKKHGNTETVLMLDAIKDMGFSYSTKGAITISVSDMEIPKDKFDIIDETNELVEKYNQAYQDGLVSDQERYEKVCGKWVEATERVTNSLMESLDNMNNLYVMANSGARGSRKQIAQIGGMRGLMTNAAGRTIEIPIKSNFREGLSVLDYFISTNGARKGLADTALRTADSGYLTRRLVDVSHAVIVREEDCGTEEGIEISAFTDGKEVIEPLEDRIFGRVAAEDIIDPKTGTLICGKGHEIAESEAKAITEAGIETVKIRSVMKCQCRKGVCSKCYGRNLATGEMVNIGEAVGIMAAQSIGEPGTQLTMRTFHTGGVAGADITQGLPRVEELFEARKPKGIATICEEDGEVIHIGASSDTKETEVITKNSEGEERIYHVPYGARMNVHEGDQVKAGMGITKGPLDPSDILRLRGTSGVYEYLLQEVQRVYKLQGVDINDKHIELIVNQMLSKVVVEDAGDTELLTGATSGQYSRFEVEEANEKAIAAGGEPARVRPTLLGITKASLANSSFLSAASFQETTRVLTEAAIKGKVDHLEGMKENVIIGRLIPAGTGLKRYRNVEVDYGEMAGYIEEKRNLKGQQSQHEEIMALLDDNPIEGQNSEVVGGDQADPEKAKEEAKQRESDELKTLMVEMLRDDMTQVDLDELRENYSDDDYSEEAQDDDDIIAEEYIDDRLSDLQADFLSEEDQDEEDEQEEGLDDIEEPEDFDEIEDLEDIEDLDDLEDLEDLEDIDDIDEIDDPDDIEDISDIIDINKEDDDH